jgi:hypothetical protein
MAKVRAYGADATLLAARETSYGVLPVGGWRSLDFKSTDLSATQPLGEDPLLGRGRNAQDPYRVNRRRNLTPDRRARLTPGAGCPGSA